MREDDRKALRILSYILLYAAVIVCAVGGILMTLGVVDASRADVRSMLALTVAFSAKVTALECKYKG
ncbi:MAG: hypothetical protein IKG69_07080 [Atopobiaceae bacterium]|nr:hypothetical protein [Atopobiaceae bacterium]MBR3384948.1 hypothetical protein [Atopobiaceae bacterium]